MINPTIWQVMGQETNLLPQALWDNLPVSEFDIRYKLKDLSTYLKGEQILLVKMIQIFRRTGFVTIENGVMRSK